MLSRRAFLVSHTASLVIVTAPAVVPASSLIRVRSIPAAEPPPQIGCVQRLYFYSRARAIDDLLDNYATPNQIARALNRHGLLAVDGQRWIADLVSGFVQGTRRLRLNPPLWRPGGVLATEPSSIINPEEARS